MREDRFPYRSQTSEHPPLPPWEQEDAVNWHLMTKPCVTLHGCPTVFAYLGDPCAVFGAAVLFAQKNVVEGYVAARLPGRSIDRFFVDSGRRDGPPAPGAGVSALLAEGRRNDGERILVVECISRLAPSLPIAFRVLAALWRVGIEVHEVASGVVSCDEALIARVYGGYRQRRVAGTVPVGASRRRASVTGDAGP